MKKLLFIITLGAAALSATSCFDNLEPAGLEQMRGAKAELLSAEAALELAEVKIKEAQALQEAAEAAYQEALVEEQKLINERELAINEYRKKKQELELAGEALALAELEKQHEINMQKIANAMEEAALRHEKKLVELQEDIAEAEAEYQKALVDLKYAQTVYAKSEYADELEMLIASLSTCRFNIATCHQQIASYTRANLHISTLEIPELERLLNNNVKADERKLELALEKVDLLKAARDANEEQFAALAAEAKKNMDDLVAKWNSYIGVEYNNVELKLAESWAAYNELYNKLNGFSASNSNYLADPSLDPTYTITLNDVPADYFENILKPYNSGFVYDETTKVVTLDVKGLALASNTINNILNRLQTNAEIPALTATQIADIQYRIGQYGEILIEQEAEYTKALETYKARRQAFLDAAERYGYDWSSINDNPAEHRWAKVRETIINYYKDYDEKIADDPSYVPSDADLKTKLATPIANYLINVVEITDNFGLDKLEVLDPTKPDEYTRMSAALLATSGDFRKERLITEYTGANGTPEAMADYLIKDAENLSPMANYPYPTEISSWDADKKAKLYPSVVGDMVNAFEALYGVAGFSLADITEEHIIFTKTKEDRQEGLNMMNYENYVPSYYGTTFVIADGPQVFYRVSTNWSKVSFSPDGLLLGKTRTQMAIEDLTYIVENQPELGADQTALNKIIEDVKVLAEALEADVKALRKEVDDAYEAYLKIQDEHLEFAYNNQVLVDEDGNLIDENENPKNANYGLAEIEYLFYKGLYTTYTTAMNTYKIVNSEGTTIPTTPTIEEAIEDAEDEAEQAAIDLENSKMILAAWVENGCDFTSDTWDLVIANNERIIDDLEEQLAEYEDLFKILTAQMNALIDLMKSETVTE